MTPDRFYRTAILPALTELSMQGLPARAEAARFILAIALQESNLAHRRQLSSTGEETGPAASFGQFEIGGGCKGVLRHPATAERMARICKDFNVTPEPQALWEAMRYNDIVAAAAMRLLIYTLPHELPTDAADGWKQYVEAWRPGKPHPERWAASWGMASNVVGVK